MPKIQWLNLPVALRQHLFDRAKEREISMQDIFALKNGEDVLLRFRTALGTRISEASSFAAKANIPGHFS
jgi:hypothetical protein